MAVKLHRCSLEWLKINAHPCWKVQKALDEKGIEYEIVAGPLRPGKRDEVQQLSGQRQYPVIEFEDGRVYREESKDMAARIGAGKLFGDADTPAAPAAPDTPAPPGSADAPHSAAAPGSADPPSSADLPGPADAPGSADPPDSAA